MLLVRGEATDREWGKGESGCSATGFCRSRRESPEQKKHEYSEVAAFFRAIPASAVRCRSRTRRIEWEKVVKPIVLLVPVSSTCRHAYTAGLSTWSSPRGLVGMIRLGEGFALRCIQRLSVPTVATQLYH